MTSKRLSGCAWWRRRYWVGARNQSSHGRLTGRRQSSWIKNVWLTKASQNKETKRKEIERVDTSMGQSHHIQSQLLDIHLAIHRIHPSWYISIKHVHIEIDECQSQRDEKELHRKSFTSRPSLYISICSVVDRRLLFAICYFFFFFFRFFFLFSLCVCVCVCVVWRHAVDDKKLRFHPMSTLLCLAAWPDRSSRGAVGDGQGWGEYFFVEYTHKTAALPTDCT